MYSFAANLNLLATHNAFVVYIIIYLATVVLGNISAFLNFWFAFAGGFAGWQIVILFFVILLGETTGDCVWYFLGKRLRNTRFGNWIRKHMPGHEKAEQMLARSGKRFLYLSKFAYGSAGPVAFLLGWTTMDFKHFLKNSLLSISLSLPVLFSIVYLLYSGLSPLHALSIFRHIEIVFLLACLVFVLVDYVLIRALRSLLSRYSED